MNKRELLTGSLALLAVTATGCASEPTPEGRRYLESIGVFPGSEATVRFAGRVMGKRVERPSPDGDTDVTKRPPPYILRAEICGLYYNLHVTRELYRKYAPGDEITAECMRDEHGRYTICRLADMPRPSTRG